MHSFEPLSRKTKRLAGGGFQFKQKKSKQPTTLTRESSKRTLSRKLTEQEQIGAFKQIVEVHSSRRSMTILKKQSFTEDF